MEAKLENAIHEIQNIDEKNVIKRQKIENKYIEELKEELNKFDFNNIILKKGKYIYSEVYYECIHDDKIEVFENNKKTMEGKFIQEIKNGIIKLIFHEKYKSIVDNYEGEIFYDCRIGRGEITGDKNKKFYFFRSSFSDWLEKVDENKYNIIYKVLDERITLEMNKNINSPVRILVKDRENINIIYEIICNMSEENKLIGNGTVIDFRTGEILLVNFSTNNIISSNLLKSIPLYKDEDEYNMYNNQTKFIEKKDNIDPANDIIIQKVNEKNEIFSLDEIINDENNLEELENKLNNKFTEKKIKYFGIQDQKHAGECWLYSLALNICISNARIYGRKLENFKDIYEAIKREYSGKAKTNDEKESIMRDILPKYGLNFEKIEEENVLKEYLKKGIKCLASFYYNEKEWDNFSEYFNDDSIEQKDKIFTLDILNKQNDNIFENPDKITGHAVILSDIDENDNYLFINSWGKDWGNNGTFKMKKECLKDGEIHAIYYIINLLTEEEKNAWDNLKIKMINILKEMKSIRCPICNRSAPIEIFEKIERNIFRCPYEEKCGFEINKYDKNELFEFIAEQLISYDIVMNMDENMKFDLGFG